MEWCSSRQETQVEREEQREGEKESGREKRDGSQSEREREGKRGVPGGEVSSGAACRGGRRGAVEDEDGCWRGGAAMGGRAAAARSDLRGVAAACVWRKKMGSPGLRDGSRLRWEVDGVRETSERAWGLEMEARGLERGRG
ncbi:hypothetical protein AAC387_Pa12g0885 [Persea americana]